MEIIEIGSIKIVGFSVVEHFDEIIILLQLVT